MNNTKWEEVRQAMYALDAPKPRFQIKDRDRDTPWGWDGEWFYHFREGPYDLIEWVDIQVYSTKQRDEVRTILRRIHAPGIETETGFRIMGWINESDFVDYL